MYPCLRFSFRLLQSVDAGYGEDGLATLASACASAVSLAEPQTQLDARPEEASEYSGEACEYQESHDASGYLVGLHGST
jgi:hypothetical protein